MTDQKQIAPMPDSWKEPVKPWTRPKRFYRPTLAISQKRKWRKEDALAQKVSDGHPPLSGDVSKTQEELEQS